MRKAPPALVIGRRGRSEKQQSIGHHRRAFFPSILVRNSSLARFSAGNHLSLQMHRTLSTQTLINVCMCYASMTFLPPCAKLPTYAESLCHRRQI